MRNKKYIIHYSTLAVWRILKQKFFTILVAKSSKSVRMLYVIIVTTSLFRTKEIVFKKFHVKEEIRGIQLVKIYF